MDLVLLDFHGSIHIFRGIMCACVHLCVYMCVVCVCVLDVCVGCVCTFFVTLIPGSIVAAFRDRTRTHPTVKNPVN